MSKMSRFNLELQEKANELGYSTVYEMLDDRREMDEALANIHKKYEQEKSEVLSELQDFYDNYFVEGSHQQKVIGRAIALIKMWEK